MGKGSELLHLLRTGNSGEARKLVAKIKKQGKKKFLAAVNEQDEHGCTPLHYSAGYNFLDFIEEFLEAGAVINVEDSKGSTPLHLAATNGRGEAVSILLRRGADPNIVTRSGDSPLHLASQNGQNEVVQYLVKDNASCTLLNVSGQSPLDLACQNGHASCVSHLLHSGQFNPQKQDCAHTALKLSAKHGHTQVLSILIRYGFDVNRVLPGAHGTCLHEAALYGKIETVHYLLQCGGDPSIKNSQGLTPLDIVNHYTDPRSAHQLKQILQDALANQARQRIAASSKQSANQQMYAQYYQQQQQAGGHPRTHSQSSIGHPQTHSQYPSGQDQRQSYPGQPQTYPGHPQTYAGQPQTHSQYPAHPQTHAGQPQTYVGQPQTHSQYPGHPQTHAGHPQTHAGHPQTHAGQPQTHAGQPQTHAGQYQTQSGQSSSPKLGMPVLPGSGDFAAMIASRAASRNPMVTSPTSKEPDQVIMRSSTLAGVQRPNIDRSAIAKRRNSYSEDSQQDNESYQHSNPPTLPRRSNMGPPTFKPVPPPASPSPLSSRQQSVSEAPPSPVQGSSSLPLGEVKLKKVIPKVAPPPPKEEATFENELLAKLKRRQVSIDQPPATPPTNQEEEGNQNNPEQEITPSQPETTPPQLEQKPNPPSPIKAAPKPRPKPTKAKPEAPPPKEEEQPQQQLSWQEEIARRKAQREKDEQLKREEEERQEAERKKQEEIKRAEQLKREEELRKAEELRREEELKRQEELRKAEELRRNEELRRAEEQRKAEELRRGEISPPKPRPKPSKAPVPIPTATSAPSAPPTTTPTGIVLPSSMITPGPASPSIVLPSSMISPGPIAAPTVTAPINTAPVNTAPIVPPAPINTAPTGTAPVTTARTVPAPITTTTVPAPVNTGPTVSAPINTGPIVPAPINTGPIVPAPVNTAPIASTSTVLEKPVQSYSLEQQQQHRERETSPIVARVIEEERPLTPSSDQQMSRSTSLSSIQSVPLPAMPQSAFECLPTAEWLTSYKLPEYIPVLEGAGYDNTDFLLGISSEELAELGVTKIGHRKRMLSALGQLISKEHFLTFTPTSVAEWLQQLGLSVYESLMIDSGYDDIEFITSVSEDELIEIGITKKGHLKRFKKGIQELSDLLKSEQSIPSSSPYTAPYILPSSPAHSASNLSSSSQNLESMRTSVTESETLSEQENIRPTLADNTVPVTRRPPKTTVIDEQASSIGSSGRDSGIELAPSRKSGNFNRMKHMLEKRMGIPVTGEIDFDDEDDDEEDTPRPSPPPPITNEPPHAMSDSRDPTSKGVKTAGAPPPVPRRAISTSLTQDQVDGQEEATDSNTLLEEEQQQQQQPFSDTTDRMARAPSLLPELDELESVLQGFGEMPDDDEEEEQSPDEETVLDEHVIGIEYQEAVHEPSKTEQLLVDIDDMLADLNDHLDIIIPGNNS